MGSMNGRGAHDQLNFHEKVIRTFAQQWPRPQLDDYLSATTPGYHLVLAAFASWGVSDLQQLRLIGLGLTVGLLATLSAWVAWRMDRVSAFVVCLPFAVSLYIVQSGAWLLPDNFGWWLVLLALMLALRREFDAWTLLWGGVLLALLVVVRQIHIWAALPIWVAAWLSADVEDDPAVFESPDGRVQNVSLALMTNMAVRLFHVFLAVLASAPAFALLLLFQGLWAGLVPPTFQAMYRGEGPTSALPIASPAAPAFFLSIFGVASLFFAGFLIRPMLEILRRWSILVPAMIAVGVLLALLPETTYMEPNRTSGFWRGVQIAPVLFGRTSLLLLILAPLGAVALLAWAWALPNRSRWIILSAIAGFIAAQSVSAQLWQRYTEPFILMLLAMMASEVAPRRSRQLSSPIARFGPLGLALLAGVITTWKIGTGPVARDLGIRTLKETVTLPRDDPPRTPDESPPPVGDPEEQPESAESGGDSERDQ